MQKKTHTNEQTVVTTIIYSFLLRILIFLTGDKKPHVKEKKESVNCRMLGISEQVEKIFQWGKEILSSIYSTQAPHLLCLHIRMTAFSGL